MSQNLVLWIEHLKFIASIQDPMERNVRLKRFADNMEFFDALKEIAINTMNMNVPLKITQKEKLRRYARTIRELADKKPKSKLKRKKLIEQSGGFLPILIPLVASVIGEVLKNR